MTDSEPSPASLLLVQTWTDQELITEWMKAKAEDPLFETLSAEVEQRGLDF